MPAAGGRFPGLGLVREQLGDALRGQGFAHAGVKIVWQRGQARLTGSLGAEVRELLALEKVCGDHRRALSATMCG